MQNKAEEIKFQTRMNREYTLDRIEKIIRSDYKNFGLYFDVFKKFIGKNSVIVDAMCGPAFFSFILYKKGYKNITGFDISPDVISTTKKLFSNHGFKHARFFASDIEDIKIADNYADFVFVLTSLHHLPSMQRAAKEIRRILKRGGHFVAVEPNALNPHSAYRHWVEKRTGMASLNERLPTTFTIKKAFVKAGFSEVSVHTFRFIPNIAGAARAADKILSSVPVISKLGSKIVLIARK